MTALATAVWALAVAIVVAAVIVVRARAGAVLPPGDGPTAEEVRRLTKLLEDEGEMRTRW